MNILREEYLVALNGLIVACREAASSHATAADVLKDRALSEQLSALGRDRTAVADELAEAVIAADDIPNAPSDEKELLEAAATRLKTAISRDETAQILADCKAKEHRVAELAETTLGHRIGEDLRERIATLQEDAASRLDRLMRDHLSP